MCELIYVRVVERIKGESNSEIAQIRDTSSVLQLKLYLKLSAISYDNVSLQYMGCNSCSVVGYNNALVWDKYKPFSL